MSGTTSLLPLSPAQQMRVCALSGGGSCGRLKPEMTDILARRASWSLCGGVGLRREGLIGRGCGVGDVMGCCVCVGRGRGVGTKVISGLHMVEPSGRWQYLQTEHNQRRNVFVERLAKGSSWPSEQTPVPTSPPGIRLQTDSSPAGLGWSSGRKLIGRRLSTDLLSES